MVWGGNRTNWTNFGGDQSIFRWVNNKKYTIGVIACPGRGGAGHDPEGLGLALHHQDPAFINAYCQPDTNLVDQVWGLLDK